MLHAFTLCTLRIQANLRLMKKLIQLLTPERVLRPLLPYVQHANSHIREQAWDILPAACLLYGVYFMLYAVCSLLTSLLAMLIFQPPESVTHP